MKRNLAILFPMALAGFLFGMATETANGFPACDNKCRERRHFIDCENKTNCWSYFYRQCTECEGGPKVCINDGFTWGTCGPVSAGNERSYHSLCTEACDCTGKSISEGTQGVIASSKYLQQWLCR